MTVQRVLASLAIALVTSAGGVSGQGLQEQIGTFTGPSQDGPPPPSAPVIGKGVVSGTVVNAKTNEPLRKAHVTLNGPNIQLNAVTDSTGVFTFRALPEGMYFISAMRENFYVSNGMPNAQSQITLKSEEEKHDVPLKLMPGATLSGRVLDEDDNPHANCSIQAFRFDSSLARKGFAGQNGGANTDGQGKYRIAGLMPGRYMLRANCSETFPAPHGFLPVNDPLAPVEGFAPATYGATPASSAGESSGLLVTAGADLAALDFHVRRVPLFIVAGSVSGVDSAMLQSAQIMLALPDATPGADVMQSIQIDAAHGRFTIRSVPAGSYELTALIINGEAAFEAHQFLEVGKTAISEANLKLVGAPSLAGTIDSDDPNTNYENWQISLAPLANNYRGPYPNAKVAKDGSFQFQAVLPGHFRLNPVPVGYLKSVSLAGRDVSPLDFEITNSGAGPLHIQLGTKMAKIEVALSPAPKTGQSFAGLLLGENPEVFDGRNISMCDPAGRLTFPAVAPGKYRLLAIDSPNPWILFNQPSVLKSLESRAVAVEVAEGDDKQISATVVSVDDLQKALEATE